MINKIISYIRLKIAIWKAVRSFKKEVSKSIIGEYTSRGLVGLDAFKDKE